MGTCYYLINDDEKEIIEFDGLVKFSLILKPDPAIAIVRYMIDHQGDKLRMINDLGSWDEEYTNYTEVDLKDE